MSAIEEMLCMLDERGIEYTLIPEDMYGSREYIKIGVTEIRTNGCDEIAVYFLTPEQAVNAVQGSDIVRCRDCKHISRDSYGGMWFCYRPECEIITEPNGFCAWGERRNA